MTTSQNNSRLGLYILAVVAAIFVTGAVWANGNAQQFQSTEVPAMDVTGMTATAGDMPVQIITNAI